MGSLKSQVSFATTPIRSDIHPKVGSQEAVDNVRNEWAKSMSTGSPTPLGSSKVNNGVNFALYSKEASQVTLCLFNESGELMEEIGLEPTANKTGGKLC